jgi:hypothetical protein
VRYATAPPALEGSPADGDTDVPTDVLPFYDANAAWLAVDSLPAQNPSFILTSSKGDAIRATFAKSHVWTVTLTPERQLEPQTTYTLRGTWDLMGTGTGGPTSADVAILFTTGAGPYTGVPPAPAARLQHYQIKGAAVTSCSPAQTGSCVSFADGSLPMASTPFIGGADGGFPFGPYLYRRAFYTDLSGIMQGTPFDCIRLTSRAPNGKDSDPTVLCRSDGPLLMLTGSDQITCTSRGIEHDGVVYPPGDMEDAGGTKGDGSTGGMGVGGASGDEPASRESCTVSSGRQRGGFTAGALWVLAVGGWLRGFRRARLRADRNRRCRPLRMT